MGLATGLVTVLNFGQTMVLAHLLAPRDFGLMAMIWVFLGLAQMLADAGVSNAIIQKQEVTRQQLSTLYWLTLAAGAGITVLISLGAPLVADFYKEPALKGILPWVALNFALTALGQQFRMLAQRELRFHVLAVSDVSLAVTAAAVSILLAVWGAGVYSLVFGGLASTAARSAVLLAAGWSRWRPSFHFHLGEIRGFLAFGGFQLGDRIFNYAWSNVDYLLAGRFLGAANLGIYRLAYELVVRPLGTINPIFNAVAYPLFAKKQHDDAALRGGFLELLRLVATLSLPLLAGLAAVAPLAISVLFGPQWQAAVPLVRILAVLGALRSINNPIGAVLLAKGRVGLSCAIQFLTLVVNAIAFWWAAQIGMRALAAAACLSMVVLTALTWKWTYHDVLGLPLRSWLRAMAAPAGLSGFMAVAVYALFLNLAAFTLPSVGLLSILVCAGGLLYAGSLWLSDRAYFRSLWRMVLHGSE